MKTFFIFLLLGLQYLSAEAIPGSFSQIETQGGGWQTGFAQHPDGRLYCRTDVGGVYRSDDFGDSWTYLSSNFTSLAPLFVHGVAVSPSDEDLVLIACGTSYVADDPNRGIWKSTDGGANWRQVSSELNFSGNDGERFGGEALIFHPDSDSELFAATRGLGLHRSTDTGESWSKIGGNTFDGVNLAGVYIHSSFPDQVFVYGTGGCWFSLDRGESFTRLYESEIAYRVVRKDDGTLFCSDNEDLWRYRASDWNNPATWQRTNIFASDQAISAIQVLANGDLFVAPIFSNLHISSNDGDTYSVLPKTLIGEVPNWHIAPGQFVSSEEIGVGYTHLLQDVTNPERYFLTGGYGVTRSSNSGQTWEFFPNDINQVVCWKVLFHPTDPEKVLLPMADHAVAVLPEQSSSLVATNYNARHFAFPDDIVNFAHAAFYSGSRIIVAGGEASQQQLRLYISNDDGVSWARLSHTGLPSGPWHPVVSGIAAKDNPDELLLIVGGNFGPGLGGVYRSTDAGRTFTQSTLPDEAVVSFDGSPYNGGSEFTWFNDVHQDGEGSDVRYIIQRFNRLLRSQDRGQTWEIVRPLGLEGSATYFNGLLSTDPKESGRLWLSVSDGLWTSTNFGDSFTRVGDFTSLNPDVRFDTVDGRVVVRGQRSGDTFDKVYYSPNNGVDWGEVSRENYRLPDTQALSLDPYRPGTVWVATGGQSVLKFTPNLPITSKVGMEGQDLLLTVPPMVTPPRVLTSDDLATPFTQTDNATFFENGDTVRIPTGPFGPSHFFRMEP